MQSMGTKVIVITGASSGIGAALSRRLSAEGHALALAARNPEQLAVVVAECGDRARGFPTDVTQRNEVARLRDAAIAAYGHIDVWVNNAGRGINKVVIDLTDAELDEMMLVNTKSALYGMQAIAPHFMARGEGQVINISSVLSRVPAASFRSAYSAAKAALNVLTANFRMDIQATHPRIAVSLVLPGSVPGAFQKNSLGGTPQAGAVGVPAPPQTPEDVAAVIAALIEAPAAEAYTRPELREIAQRYHDDVEAFERSLTVGR
jgi:NADP-dependent 3-hydroxy acid dehydrogenase YdfG